MHRINKHVSVPKGFETLHSPSVRKHIPLSFSKATMKPILSLAQTIGQIVDSDCSQLYSKPNHHLQLKDFFKISICFTKNKAEPTVELK